MKISVELTDKDLGRILLQRVAEMLGIKDDAGCDWYTSGKNIYIGSIDWQVARNRDIATIVDAANIFLYGNRLTLD